MSDRSAPLTERQYVVPFVLVTSLFFVWAIGVNLNDVLIPHLKKALDLSDFQSSLIQTAFFGGYFLMALPAGWIMRRVGYRKGILTGLGLCALGTLLFQPAATARWYPFFLLALFVMACGQCVLEVAANPYVTVLGPPGSAARRLNTAQMFNALGAVITPILGAQFILSGVEHTSAQLATMSPAAIETWRATEAAGVKGPYLVITAIFLAVGVMIALSKLPEVKEPGEGSGRGLASAWRHAHLRRGVFAQFCYVGAQVGVASFVIRFAQDALPGTGERVAADFLKWHLAGFLAGRVVGTALMTRIPAPRLLASVAALGIVAGAYAATGSGAATVWMIVLLGLFHSIQFPTIFALAIDGIGDDTKLGSSLLVMSIVGGAIIPAVMGAISDARSIQMAFWIPVLCYGVVLHFALRGHKHDGGHIMSNRINRWCLALDLKDEPALIAEYCRLHEHIWPEIAASIRDAGVVGMEIWHTGNRLTMVMETDERFDAAAKAIADAANPKVAEWEFLMWKFQQPLPWADPGQKWVPMQRIFDLSQQR